MRRSSSRAAALLAAVHAHPGITRAEAGRLIGVGTGASTELVARLAASGMVSELAAPASGRRGRPTTVLGPHPDGPLVLAVSISHEAWTVAAVELGGATVAHRHGEHDAGPDTMATVTAAVTALRRRYRARIGALGVAAPGVVSGRQLVQAATLRWHDVDLGRLWPRAPILLAGNDASLAAVAESARGAAVGARSALHIRVDAGIGGALVEAGRLVTGAAGVAGEFGHMPFGDPAVRCPCGATGCWGTAVDGSALARALGRRPPRDEVSYARRVIAAGTGAERAAVAVVGAALGRGLAGLVNGLDPELVTLGGLGTDLLAAVPHSITDAYRAGLMTFRRSSPPPLLPAAAGPDGPLSGAGELAWTEFLPTLTD